MPIRLSFDDGPGPSTPELLDVLRDADCRATFFLLGANLDAARDTARRMAREGHVLGNHTYTHARPGALAPAALADEIAVTDALIRQAYRDADRVVPARIPLRLPYGPQPDDPRLSVLWRLGREHVHWTLMAEDWRRPPPSPQAMFADIARHLVAGHATGHGAGNVPGYVPGYVPGDMPRDVARDVAGIGPREIVLCLHDGSRHREARPATVALVRRLLAAGHVRPHGLPPGR